MVGLLGAVARVARNGGGERTDDTVTERVHLRDGSSVTVRAVRPSDAPLVADAFNRLSLISRHHRFLGSKTTLTPSDLRRLTVVDHRVHVALIAVSTADHRAVGFARYIRSSDRRHLAEVAITVIDEWHRRGLGRVLVDRLVRRACAEGVAAFSALIADHNAAALALLRSVGARAEIVECGFGVTEYALDLSARGRAGSAAARPTAGISGDSFVESPPPRSTPG